jgi:toxin ParE1/3/4
LKRLILSHRARTDLADIWNYSAEQWSVTQADAYITAIRQACEDLLEGRRTGRAADLVKPGYRTSYVASHTLYFRVENDSLIIVRILHQSMEPEARL